jgi:hypothetical protein
MTPRSSRTFWHRPGWLVGRWFGLGAAVGAGAVLLDVYSVVGITASALSNDNRGEMFGALVGAASMLVTVLLAILGLITSLETRKAMRVIETYKLRDELIYGALAPILALLLLLALSLVALLLPATVAGDRWAKYLVGGIVALTASGLAQSGALAVLIAKILIWNGRSPSVDSNADLAAFHKAAHTVSPVAEARRESETPSRRIATATSAS